MFFFFQVPDERPPRLKAESFTSPTNLPITWESFPVGVIPGVLTGYQLWYTPTARGDDDIEEGQRKTIQIAADQRRVVLENLEINTKYKIELAARTKKGLGPSSFTFGG